MLPRVRRAVGAWRNRPPRRCIRRSRRRRSVVRALPDPRPPRRSIDHVGGRCVHRGARRSVGEAHRRHRSGSRPARFRAGDATEGRGCADSAGRERADHARLSSRRRWPTRSGRRRSFFNEYWAPPAQLGAHAATDLLLSVVGGRARLGVAGRTRRATRRAGTNRGRDDRRRRVSVRESRRVSSRCCSLRTAASDRGLQQRPLGCGRRCDPVGLSERALARAPRTVAVGSRADAGARKVHGGVRRVWRTRCDACGTRAGAAARAACDAGRNGVRRC